MLLQTPAVPRKPKINRWPIKHHNCLWKSFSPPSKSNSHFPFTKFVCCFLWSRLVLDGVQTSIHFYHRFWGRGFVGFFFLFILHLKVKSLMGSLHREGIVPGEEVIYDKKKGVWFQRLLTESFRKPWIENTYTNTASLHYVYQIKIGEKKKVLFLALEGN